VWRWDQAEPFGNNPADENPSGLGAFDLPLRLPGQRYDKETNLHYNFYRDYDPSLGIYKQSDPIGLAAGPNTYVYVKASPLRFRDFFGLETCGSGGNEPYVPDNPLLFPFSECCRAHDACYDDCTRRLSKGRCDNDFQSCALQKCQRRWTGVKFACELLAVTYYAFVNSSGTSAFEEARKKCATPPCIPQGSK
jgi:RHS repeat-associated protein